MLLWDLGLQGPGLPLREGTAGLGRQWGWSCTFWSLGGRGTDPEEGFPPARVNWVRGRARDTSVSLSSQLLSLRMAVAAGMFILWQFLLLCRDVNCLYFCLLIKCHLCACTCCA